VIRIADKTARHAFRTGIALNARTDFGATTVRSRAIVDVHQTGVTILTEVVHVEKGILAKDAKQSVQKTAKHVLRSMNAQNAWMVTGE